MHLQHLRLSLTILSATLGAVCAVTLPAQAQITTFSSGYLTPENITLAPSSFGTYGGEYFINDAARNDATKSQLYTLPTTGGSPTSFASNLPGFAIGALFLPSAGWGSNSGHYLTVGATVDGSSGKIITYDANANPTTFYTAPNGTFSYYAQATIAPSTFGANAGKLIVSDEGNGIYAFDSSANVTQLTQANGTTPFAVQFAPTGFGQYGDTLFTDDGSGGAIDSIDANGNISPFATVTLQNGQVGLRQLAFAPADFLPGINEPLLFVSVSGSQVGGGTLGDILAYDQNGTEVASLRTDLGLITFDPRGLYFLNNGNLLVNDASDPILLLTPNAFTLAVPEPSAFAFLLAGGLGARFAFRRRNRKK